MERVKQQPSQPFFNNLIVFLLTFFLPTQLGRHFFLAQSFVNGIRVDYLSPTIYFFDLLALLFFLFNWKKVFSFLKNKKFLFFILLLIFNISFSIFKIISFYKAIKLIEWWLLFLLIKKIKPWEAIKKGFFFSGLFQFFLALTQFINQGSLNGVFWLFGERNLHLSYPGIAKTIFFGKEILRPYATFSHPNSLAGFYLLLYFAFLTIKKINQRSLLNHIALFVFSGLILLSFSKVAIVCWFLGNLFWLTKKINCRLCFIAKIFIFLITSLIFLSSKNDLYTIPNRWDLFKESWLVFKKNLLTGVGLGAYVKAKELLSSINLKYYLITQPVHNIFILFVVESGFIFVLGFIFLTFQSIKKLYKKNRLIFVLFLITGFFDHYWWTLSQNFFLLSFISALILSSPES
jgi:hypothetical protein